MMRTILFWIAAVVITGIAIVYQRQTGPTYPKKVEFSVDTVYIRTKLPRSSECNKLLEIRIPNISIEWNSYLYFRRYPTSDEWTAAPFLLDENDEMSAVLPSDLPQAGKLEYYLEFDNSLTNNVISISKDDPIIIRFKGEVPSWALLPHILLMFIAMIFSNLAGVMALFRHNKFRFYGMLTLLLMLTGGLVFGPIVQLFAFGEAWTGFPYGSDLTDNKTLIAFIFWLIAVLANWKKERPWVVIVASLVTLVVYSIPHSLRGSEFDFEAGKVVTGAINILRLLLI